MATENCWEIRKECECNGMAPDESSCPPYRKSKSCWDFDWLSFYEKLPASEQEVWSAELEQCVECSVFSLFSDEMRTNVLMLKENFHHD